MRNRIALVPTPRPIRNEGKCCDAVIRRIESELSLSRCDLRSPEKERDTAPVDIACQIGNRLYAFEHTLVEPMEGLAKMEAEAEIRVRPISEKIEPSVPSGETWQLLIRWGKLQELRGRHLAQVQQAIVRWVLSEAVSVEMLPYGSYRKPFGWSYPSDIPFEVRLDRWKNTATGHKFQIRYAVDQHVQEPNRMDRLLRACQKKLPKLQEWKGRGARTVLVLEDTDLFSTNEVLVFESLQRVQTALTFWPGEIYLVGSYLDSYWPIWALWLGDQSFWTLDDQGVARTECPTELLVDLMQA